MVKTQTTTIYGSLPHRQNINVSRKVDKTYGVAWPVGNNNGTYFQKATGYYLIRANMLQLLLTGLGERLMLPNFGTSLKNLLFENVDPLQIDIIREQIVDAYEEFMPNLTITNVSISTVNDGDGSNTPFEFGQLRDFNQPFQKTSNAYALRISATYPDLDRPVELDVPILSSGGILA
tara:strand:+ start:94 stop:624 length:531 start_codon:yes stop_codon:yes gene_type:complete